MIARPSRGLKSRGVLPAHESRWGFEPVLSGVPGVNLPDPMAIELANRARKLASHLTSKRLTQAVTSSRKLDGSNLSALTRRREVEVSGSVKGQVSISRA